jgi:hypothetical protein
MKSTHFRIGNIVTLCHENLPDIVVSIEPGLIYLANRTRPDDERDISGVFITIEKLTELNFFEKSKGLLFSIHTTESERVELSFSFGNHTMRYKYLHELQNAIFCFTCNELIPFPKQVLVNKS